MEKSRLRKALFGIGNQGGKGIEFEIQAGKQKNITNATN